MDIFYQQRDFFSIGKTLPLSHRLEGLDQLEKALKKENENIFQALYQDLGKSAIESEMSETRFVLDEIKRAKKNLKSWAKPQKVRTPLLLQPGKSFIAPYPLGVVLILSPWNYPLRLSLCPLIGALAAGNCSLLHLSPHAPHTAKVIEKFIAQSFPKEWVTVLTGGIKEVQQLLTLPLGHIFFTGGAKVGSLLSQAAAKTLTPITLELGGQNPAIVHRDAPLPVTARRLAFGKFFNNAQTCVAPNCIFVHEQIAKDLIHELSNVLIDWQKTHSWGKIINRAHWERLDKMLRGQNIIYGGKRERNNLSIEPTLVFDPSWESTLMTEEIFGPILSIKTYKDSEKLLETLRQKFSPLASYLFTYNSNLQERFLQTIPCGQACLNDVLLQANNPSLPFGGVGKSGYGRYHGRQSFLTFSSMKSVLKKPFYLDISLRYPPYTPRKKKWLRRFL